VAVTQSLRRLHDAGVSIWLDTLSRQAWRSSPVRTGAGIDVLSVTEELEREGIESFCDSYHQLLECVEAKRGALAGRAS
jgi:hypothetical protein